MIPQTNYRLSDGISIPVYRLNTVILGAGAAGMNCAVHLYEFHTGRGVAEAQDRIAVVTNGLGLGASRMSGSDKQTYYKMGTSPTTADSAIDFAKTLTAFGCMHGDIALAEAESSLREFFHLVQAGVPFPHDPEGAFVGYKTDHDPYERATSAGPKTSMFMSACLQRQAERYGVKIFDGHEAVHFLTSATGSEKRIVGLVTLDKSRLDRPDFGMTVFLCENLVLAAGGPGALYEVSVFPRGQTGVHGLALKAGLRMRNMIEWQFGLASTKFRWNVSGTYMQVVPRLFSTDKDGGNVREFLVPHFPSMSSMATNIFLKGYQWPFDAQRVQNHQSSLIDLLVTHERRALGRRVFMDFLRNPVGGPGMEPFAIDKLTPEARIYLERNGALQATPLERLAHMNPQAIDIYREHDIDLSREPLEIDVCAQHHNGGFAVDKWWQSSMPRTFVIGEMAGTHGVKRPGGAALNSGQTGGMRAAEYIAAVYGGGVATEDRLGKEQQSALHGLLEKLRNLTGGGAGRANPQEVLTEIQRRSSDAAAHMRSLDGAETAMSEARRLCESLREHPPACSRREDVISAVQVEHLAVTHLALLEALVDYLRRGGGSRGSYVVLHPMGTVMHEGLVYPRTGRPYSYVPENASLRGEIPELELTDAAALRFSLRSTAIRPMPQRDEAFERTWTAFRQDDIYRI